MIMHHFAFAIPQVDTHSYTMCFLNPICLLQGGSYFTYVGSSIVGTTSNPLISPTAPWPGC